jgi:hypothetical protein
MNIQDEMNRIFKMQKDNLTNERKFKERCKNGVGEWEVLPNFETLGKLFPRWGTQVFGR